MDKIIIALDPRKGLVTRIFTSNPKLAAEVVVIDPGAPKPVTGPYDPGVTMVVPVVDDAAAAYIQTKVPGYQGEATREVGAPALFTWMKTSDLWPYLTGEGRITCVSVADEPSRLFLASILPYEGSWTASLLLDGVHKIGSTFSSLEEEQDDAERMLTNSLLTGGLLADASPLLSFGETPFFEAAALLVILLDAEMQIVHLSAYKSEWVAVCVSNDGTTFEDYVFTRDSDEGFLARRLTADRLAVRA